MEHDILIQRIHLMDQMHWRSVHDQFYPVVIRYVRYRLDDEQLVEILHQKYF